MARAQPINSPKRHELRIFLIFTLLVAAIVSAFGQDPTATLSGKVVDQTGAVVKDVKVSVVNTATGAVREAVSGSDGSATVPALSLTGAYTVGDSRNQRQGPRVIIGRSRRIAE